MLGFVVPIKSPKVSSSWQSVSMIFERTARSICQQTHPNFKVVVVCHEPPNICFTHPNLEYILADDLPIPETWYHKRGDKMHKVLRGIRHAKGLGCSHIMLVDSDDCISNRLVEYMADKTDSPGYFFNKGYFYNDNSRTLRLVPKRFHKTCGTSHIINSKFYDISDAELNQLPNLVYAKSKLPKHIYDLYCTHGRFVEAVQAKGGTLKPLPFAGSIYILGNTENLSVTSPSYRQRRQRDLQQALSINDMLVKFRDNVLYRRPLTKSLREQFGIYDINLPT